MNRIQVKMEQVKSTHTLVLVLGVIAVTVASWLTFALAAWNQNLLFTVLAMVIPAVLFRALLGRKIFKASEDLEMILFGVLLWNHMLAIIIILFVLKVLVSKLRK